MITAVNGRDQTLSEIWTDCFLAPRDRKLNKTVKFWDSLLELLLQLIWSFGFIKQFKCRSQNFCPEVTLCGFNGTFQSKPT